MSCVAVLIPAAGAARRMRGRDKLLEQIDGVPLLAHVANRACAVASDVIVTLPAGPHPRHTCLEGHSLGVVEVADPSEGMAASIRAGITALPHHCDGVMILPADMPDLTQQDLALMLEAFRNHDQAMICRAANKDGVAGHPVIFPTEFFDALGSLTGDQGGRAILRQNHHRLIKVTLPGNHALTDLDSPEAWQVWRSQRVEKPQDKALKSSL
jgi:molybdenum cofactor cytidylyltransferase